MTPGFDAAQFDAFLADITEPFLTRDITKWRRRMLLPFSMVTKHGPIILTNDDEVSENFNLYVMASHAMRLTDVVRTPRGYENCPDGSVIATYSTELLSNALRVTQPYTASALLLLTTDGWKMSSILNARGHHDWTGQYPHKKGNGT